MAAHNSPENIEHALKQYSEGKITIGKAARIAGIPLREMIAISAERGIHFQYSLDDLNEDVEIAESL